MNPLPKRNTVGTRALNHVSSEPEVWWLHRTAPFRTDGDPVVLLRRLGNIVASMPRTEIVTAIDGYMHAVCRTRLGYRDDLEFRWSPADGVIHVTSTSRVGNFDFAMNRRRVWRVRWRLGVWPWRSRPRAQVRYVECPGRAGLSVRWAGEAAQDSEPGLVPGPARHLRAGPVADDAADASGGAVDEQRGAAPASPVHRDGP